MLFYPKGRSDCKDLLCGAYMAATLGVANFNYFPHAEFNYASPLLVVLMAAAGLRILKRHGAALPEPERDLPRGLAALSNLDLAWRI